MHIRAKRHPQAEAATKGSKGSKSRASSKGAGARTRSQSRGQERLPAPEPGTAPPLKRGFPTVRLFGTEGKEDDNDLEPETRPSWRKASPSKVNIQELESLAAALAAAPETPARAESSKVPPGPTPAQEGASPAAPVTPPGAVANTLFDQGILLKENELLKQQVAELNEKGQHLNQRARAS